MIKSETKHLKDCTLAEYTDCLIKGNYYGFKESYISNYFSNNPYKINSYEYIDLYEHNKLQHIFEKFIISKNLKISEEYSFDNHSSKNPPHKTDLEFDKSKFMKIYRDGTIFLEDTEDKSIIIVDICCDDSQRTVL